MIMSTIAMSTQLRYLVHCFDHKNERIASYFSIFFTRIVLQSHELFVTHLFGSNEETLRVWSLSLKKSCHFCRKMLYL